MLPIIQSVRSFQDVQEMVAIHNSVWPRSYGLIELLTDSSACYLSKHAKTDQVTGYAFVAHDMPRDSVELNDLAVARQYRHQGHGRAIVRHLMTMEREIRLCADSKRSKLIQFYYRLGFQKETVYENYYGIGRDAFRLIWRAM